MECLLRTPPRLAPRILGGVVAVTVAAAVTVATGAAASIAVVVVVVAAADCVVPSVVTVKGSCREAGSSSNSGAGSTRGESSSLLAGLGPVAALGPLPPLSSAEDPWMACNGAEDTWTGAAPLCSLLRMSSGKEERQNLGMGYVCV